MNVLLVEDDDGVREVMADLLGDSARVLALQGLSDALRELEQKRFDLVIADLRLRGSGEGGRQIIATAHRRLMPVVIMTGLQGDEMKRAVGNTVPDAVMLKPFSIEEAMATYRRFVRVWQELAQLAETGPAPAWEAFDDPGVRVQVVAGEAHRGRRWLAFDAGARASKLSFPVAQAAEVTAGKVTLHGEELAPGRPFFLSAGQSYDVVSEPGATVALASLPAISG